MSIKIKLYTDPADFLDLLLLLSVISKLNHLKACNHEKAHNHKNQEIQGGSGGTHLSMRCIRICFLMKTEVMFIKCN